MRSFTLLLVSMLTMLSGTVIVASLPTISKVFANTTHIDIIARLILTLPSLVIAITAPYFGILSDRIGRRPLLLFSLLLFALGGTSGYFFDHLGMILAGRVLLGLAVAIMMTVATALVADYYQEQDRHRFMSYQGAFSALGGIVFISGGSYLADFDWHNPFLVYLIGLVVFVFAYLYLSEPQRHAHLSNADEQEIPPRLYPIYLSAFGLMVVFYMLPTQMPFLMIDHFHAKGVYVGAVISTAMAFNALMAFNFGRLKKHLNFQQMYILLFGLIGVGFCGIGLVPSFFYLFATAAIMGLGSGLMMTTTNAWLLSRAHQSRRGKAAGALTSALFFGQFCSPLLTQPIVRIIGVQHLFFVVGSGLLLLALILFFFQRQHTASR
ncbi:MAG: MFS transporter [Campylobacterales bacterium]|nr:MFS transporter [Campylobacterales bacterium]